MESIGARCRVVCDVKLRGYHFTTSDVLPGGICGSSHSVTSNCNSVARTPDIKMAEMVICFQLLVIAMELSRSLHRLHDRRYIFIASNKVWVLFFTGS